MATKRGQNVQVFWSNYEGLPLICFLCVALYLISIPSSTWAAYRYTALLPNGWSSTGASDINNKGDVVGSGWNGTTTNEFLYSGGIYAVLLADGWTSAEANGINESRDVVGRILRTRIANNQEFTPQSYLRGLCITRGKWP